MYLKDVLGEKISIHNTGRVNWIKMLTKRMLNLDRLWPWYVAKGVAAAVLAASEVQGPIWSEVLNFSFTSSYLLEEVHCRRHKPLAYLGPVTCRETTQKVMTSSLPRGPYVYLHSQLSCHLTSYRYSWLRFPLCPGMLGACTLP